MEVQLKDFDFRKSKLKDGVVNVEYFINFKTNGNVRHPKIEDEIKDPHPDLVNSVKSFTEPLLDIWEFEAKDEFEVQATGISISKRRKKLGIVITGKKQLDGGVTSMNSHRMNFPSEEDELYKLYEEHKKEIYAALYEGKTAQLNLPFKGNKEEKTKKK